MYSLVVVENSKVHYSVWTDYELGLTSVYFMLNEKAQY